MSKWKPIETAPKDGTRMDQWTRHGKRLTDVYWSPSFNFWSNCRTPDPATHWMPLPSPPKDVK